MTIISVIGQKGGVGKSTISRLLAVEAVRAGIPACIMDLDPAQGTTTQWRLTRDRNKIEPEITVEKHRTVASALRRVETGVLTVLDGPAFADRLTLDMAKAADLVLLPSGYGTDDMAPQVEVAYSLEDRGVPLDKVRVAFCRARGSKEEDRAARRYIGATGIAMLDRRLREMPCIRQAHNRGHAASETGYLSVDSEARSMGAEILGLVVGAMA